MPVTGFLTGRPSKTAIFVVQLDYSFHPLVNCGNILSVFYNRCLYSLTIWTVNIQLAHWRKVDRWVAVFATARDSRLIGELLYLIQQGRDLYVTTDQASCRRTKCTHHPPIRASIPVTVLRYNTSLYAVWWLTVHKNCALKCVNITVCCDRCTTCVFRHLWPVVNERGRPADDACCTQCQPAGCQQAGRTSQVLDIAQSAAGVLAW